jgi:hypothetical protein
VFLVLREFLVLKESKVHKDLHLLHLVLMGRLGLKEIQVLRQVLQDPKVLQVLRELKVPKDQQELKVLQEIFQPESQEHQAFLLLH